MHRAALARAVAGSAACDFSYESIDVGAFGNGMAVRAMPTKNIVIGSQATAGSHRHRLLANSKVEQSHDFSRSVKRRDLLFEGADKPHRAEKGDELRRVLSLRCHNIEARRRNAARTSGGPRESPR